MTAALRTVREQVVAQIAANMEGLSIGTPEEGTEDVVGQVYREWRAPELLPDLPVAFVLDPSSSKLTGNEGAVMRTYRAQVRVFIICVVRAGRTVRAEDAGVTANRVMGYVEQMMYEESQPDIGSLKKIPGFDWAHDVGDEWTPFGDGGQKIIQVKKNFVVQLRHSDLTPFRVP